MERSEDTFDFLPVSVAALFVYREIMDRRLGDIEDPDNDAILEDVAHALSNVAPIYATHVGPDAFKAIDPVEMMFAAFERGATVLRTQHHRYENPAIRRCDMLVAIELFRRAGAKFHFRLRSAKV